MEASYVAVQPKEGPLRLLVSLGTTVSYQRSLLSPRNRLAVVFLIPEQPMRSMVSTQMQQWISELSPLVSYTSS